MDGGDQFQPTADNKLLDPPLQIFAYSVIV